MLEIVMNMSQNRKCTRLPGKKEKWHHSRLPSDNHSVLLTVVAILLVGFDRLDVVGCEAQILTQLQHFFLKL